MTGIGPLLGFRSSPSTSNSELRTEFATACHLSEDLVALRPFALKAMPSVERENPQPTCPSQLRYRFVFGGVVAIAWSSATWQHKNSESAVVFEAMRLRLEGQTFPFSLHLAATSQRRKDKKIQKTWGVGWACDRSWQFRGMGLHAVVPVFLLMQSFLHLPELVPSWFVLRQ